MKSYTHGHIKMAITAVRANGWRSFLTMLGVIIGVASVISVIGISQGVKKQVSGQIGKLGKDLITVRASRVTDTSLNGGLGLLANFNVLNTLPEKDYVTVAQLREARLTVPLSVASGEIKGDSNINNTMVIGTNSFLPDALNQDISFGVFFSPDDNDENVAVMGERAAERIFNENVPLGRSFVFRGERFQVRGIFDTFETTPLSGEVDFNDAVFIPYGTTQRITGNNAPLYEILVKPNDSHSADQTVGAINASLLKNHGGERDFTVAKSGQSLQVSNNILDILTRLVGGVAAISLLVGGIGIMNVMLVSVTERMHEIGIRKAVGATNRQLLNQFIIEASVLSVAGGILGVLFAVLIDILLRIFTDIQPVISWQVVLLACAVSLVIGIVFGSAPAFKAARKEPIDALRNE
jgi:ABC-type antimicrobial peptide transport system permease subunit